PSSTPVSWPAGERATQVKPAPSIDRMTHAEPRRTRRVQHSATPRLRVKTTKVRNPTGWPVARCRYNSGHDRMSGVAIATSPGRRHVHHLLHHSRPGRQARRLSRLGEKIVLAWKIWPDTMQISALTLPHHLTESR